MRILRVESDNRICSVARPTRIISILNRVWDCLFLPIIGACSVQDTLSVNYAWSNAWNPFRKGPGNRPWGHVSGPAQADSLERGAPHLIVAVDKGCNNSKHCLISKPKSQDVSHTKAFCLILFQQKAKTAHRPTITSPHCDYDLHKCAQACLMPCSREPQPPILFLMNPLRFSRGSLCPWAMHRGVWSTFLPAWWFTTYTIQFHSILFV